MTVRAAESTAVTSWPVRRPRSTAARTQATDAVVAWTTEYRSLAFGQMCTAGRRIDVGIDGELAQLGFTGYRPLRIRDTLF